MQKKFAIMPKFLFNFIADCEIHNQSLTLNPTTMLKHLMKVIGILAVLFTVGGV